MSDPNDRPPPHNREAERHLLAACLRSADAVNEALRLIQPEEFYVAAHVYIFEAMVALADKGKAVDVVTVATVLRKSGKLDDATPVYLAELQTEAFSAAHVSHHAEMIRDTAILRDLMHAGSAMIADARHPSASPQELLEDADRKIQHIAERQVVGEAVDMQTALRETLDRLDARRNRGDACQGVPSGFVDFDGLLGGFQDSEVILVAARPSVGKTALAVNFAWHAAVNLGLPVLFISLEQSRVELTERLLCLQGRIDSHRFRKGWIDIEEQEKLFAANDALRDSALFLDDTPGQKAMQIAASARRMQRKHGIRMVLLDYVQLVEPDNPRASQQEQVSTISRKLKFMAKDLKVPVIACAQLNRESEARPDKRPRLSDLRSSGQLEQDADVVMLLHEPGELPGVLEVNIAKNRNGPRGEVKLLYLKSYYRFENFACEHSNRG